MLTPAELGFMEVKKENTQKQKCRDANKQVHRSRRRMERILGLPRGYLLKGDKE